MRLFTTLRIVAVILLVGAGTITAADDNSQSAVNVKTRFDRLMPAGTLLNQQVVGQAGKPLGVTKDLAIDLATGHLALVLVKLSGLDQQMPGYLAVPPAALTTTDKGLRFKHNVRDSRLATARRLPESAYHKQLNRGWAEAQYKVFEERPYWVRIVEVEGETRNEPISAARDMTYRLAMMSSLQDVQVQDQSGKTIGHIRQFAVAPKTNQIAYAILELTDDGRSRRYPAPLGAFVVRNADSPWIIELDVESISNFPSFTGKQLPREIDRGWVEYTHVRYGRSALGGVQSKLSKP